MRRTALAVEYSSHGRNPRYFETLCARPIYRSNKTSSSTYYSTDIRSLCDACLAIPIQHTATGFRCKVWRSHNPYGNPLLQQWGQQECSLYCVVEPHSFMLPVYALCIRDKGLWLRHIFRHLLFRINALQSCLVLPDDTTNKLIGKNTLSTSQSWHLFENNTPSCQRTHPPHCSSRGRRASPLPHTT